MAERKVSADFAAVLHQESARWVSEGLMAEEQRKVILALYPAPSTGARERTILIFTILGSLLVGAGVILFFASNWPLIPPGVKVGAILAAVVGAYAGGFHLAYRRGDYPRLGHSLIFLGGLLYGAGIWLIAQIFHLQSDFATGWLLWGLGVLPILHVTRSLPTLYLSTVSLTVWTAMAQTGAGQSHNWLYPALAGLLIYAARRAGSALAEAGTLGGLFLWLIIGVMNDGQSTARGEDPALIAQFLLLYGVPVLLAGVARLGDIRTYAGVGGVAVLAGAYMLTFRYYHIPGAAPALWQGSPFQLGMLSLLLAAAALGAWQYWRREETGRLPVLTAALALVPAALFLPFLQEEARMVTFNLVLFAGTVGLVVLGVRQRSHLVVNLGLGVFVIHTLTRYFDLFFSAMDRSLFFVFGGLLLLGGGWLLERNRRRWMQEWGGERDA